MLSAEATKSQAGRARDNEVLNGRIAIVYALGNHYLFLPFAALCMSAAVVHYEASPWIVCTPLVLQIFLAVGAGRLKTAFEKRDRNADPMVWAHRFTAYSALSGGIWGAGAIIWFIPGSFPAQAYLVLAYLGVTATEFVSRGAYRPAYLAHALFSLFPLAALLVLQGNIYTQMTAVLILFFVGVLFTYSSTIERLLDESILLRRDYSRLIDRLSEKKAAAEVARDSAEDSERSKSAFISSISHEIRTPLNAILGMAQLLERGELERSQREHVRVLLEAGRGLKILLDDIIALAQFGDKPLSRTPGDGCDAGQAARTVGRLLQPSAWEKRLQLSITIAPGLPRAAADPRVLRRILLKLGGNAIKFTESGSIEIAVDTLEEAGGKDCLRFRITDTGPGIPAHLVDKIFDPFEKADESYARKYNGAGVGLAVAQRLVQDMNGSISVESEAGEGTIFWVTIPVAQETSVSELEPEDEYSAPIGLSMLIYLPDRAMRSPLEHMLSPSGNQVTFASSLPNIFRLAIGGNYSLVICDGSTADALAAAEAKRAPILALAGRDEQPPAGADSNLHWPTSVNELYSAIGQLTRPDEASERENGLDCEGEEGIVDTATFGDLEKSLGLTTLIDILQSYMATAEQLTAALTTALDSEEWAETARVAQDIGGAAGGLGLTALTSAARQLSQKARDGADQEALAATAKDVLAQHERTRDTLRRLYPDLAA